MDHLSEESMSALADGELSSQEMATAAAHLASCSECTTDALARMMLKQTTAQAGRRYALPNDLRARLKQPKSAKTWKAQSVWNGWAAAAVLFVSLLGAGWLRYGSSSVASSMSLTTEMTDQHVATMAASAGPEVVSSDRHTVKPWFQGKIPFSFNVPETLPDATTLDGANLTYIGRRPVAQLLYSIGKHRVSVFVMQKADTTTERGAATQVSGFHIVASQVGGLDIVAVSDVEISKLKELTTTIDQAQR